MSGVATPRDRATHGTVLAMVLAIHALLGWLFVISTQGRSIQSYAQRLEIFFVTPPAAPPDPGAPLAKLAGDSAASRRRKRASTSPLTQGQTRGPDPALPTTHGAPDRPPVDWADELSRTAQAAAALPAGPQPKEFGHPYAHETAPAKPQEFGWSHTQTHRVEAIPGGGLLVNLNDNCVLILAFPIPFAACKLGKHPANGDLFKDMRHAPSPGTPQDAE